MKILLVFLCFILFVSCNPSENDPKADAAKINFNFTHFADDQPLVFDQMIYTNAAGNQYMVNEIQYFVSDIKLHRSDGSFQLIDAWKDIHYVDTDLPETQIWNVFDDIEPGNFQKISFTFGISEEKNQSLMFVNPPERDMFWPEVLGGGYHYMKLNGKWLDENQQSLPFAFHLGIGQIYSAGASNPILSNPVSGKCQRCCTIYKGSATNPDSIIGFVQNYFEVQLPNSAFALREGDTLDFEIRMNVQNWFQNPHIYDHNYWGGSIMQKQDAMKMGCDNGQTDVFTLLIK